jgi:hypothetical protein
MIMPENLPEIDIEIVKKTPEMTPYAGALPFDEDTKRFARLTSFGGSLII